MTNRERNLETLLEEIKDNIYHHSPLVYGKLRVLLEDIIKNSIPGIDKNGTLYDVLSYCYWNSYLTPEQNKVFYRLRVHGNEAQHNLDKNSEYDEAFLLEAFSEINQFAKSTQDRQNGMQKYILTRHG